MPHRFNARMYSVTPAVEAAWKALLGRISADAGVGMDYLAYPAPQPLEALWSRADLGLVFMCGFPLVKLYPDAQPIAAPVPALPWAGGRAVYRSDFVVRTDAPFRTLADTFGHRIAWTVDHSHSGFNAARHHLLRYRTPARPRLYAAAVGPLVTARRIVDAVLDGTADVGPLDAYFHALLRRAAPETVAGLRVVESTDTAPMPPLVASPEVDAATVARLRAAFAAAAERPWFAALADPLLVGRFAVADRRDYDVTLTREHEALAAGYPMPA